MTLRALRLIAVLIAIAGAIDPAFSAARRTKPDVSLLTSGRLPDARSWIAWPESSSVTSP